MLDLPNQFPAWIVHILVLVAMFVRITVFRNAIRREPRSWHEYVWSAYSFNVALLAAIIAVAVIYVGKFRVEAHLYRDQVTFMAALVLSWFINYRFLRELLVNTKSGNP